MDIKKTIYNIRSSMEGLSLAIPMFVVGLGFMIIGVSILPGIGILLGIFIWWLAWRFMVSSSRKGRIKEALKRIKEKQAGAVSTSTSEYPPSTQKPDEDNESVAKSTGTSEE
ncbi:MAG TPA: hypothetical protein VEF34_07920 [Syntrophobacteraceae bacterium]|nr:hypothetical protein [Syntrophobacteraceae bacterium]